MAALLTLMAVMVQAVISTPLALLDEVFEHALKRPGPDLASEPFVVGCVNLIAFGVAITVGLILNRMPLRRAFPLGLPTVAQFCALAVVVLGGDILLSEIDNLFRSILTPPDWLIDAYESLLSPEGGLAGRIFLLVIVAPVTEELLFRGIVLRGLLSRYPAWLAVGLAALLFAAGHVNPWQFVSAFWLGVAFGWFYVRTGSVFVCILGHAVSNGLFVIFTSAVLDIPGLTAGPDVEVTFQPWWLDLVGAALLGIGILSFLKLTPPQQPAVSPEPPLIPLGDSGLAAVQAETAPPIIQPEPPRIPE